MIQTQNVSVHFENRAAIFFPDITLYKNESLLIHGPSGCGKSSYLHVLAGLLKPISGSITFLNQNYSSFSTKKMDAFRAAHIGICLQRPVFIKSLTAYENLWWTQKTARGIIDKNYIHELFQVFQLDHIKHQKTYTLSQGEQQRLMFARALVNKPELILADEPTSSLDDRNTNLMISFLLQQCQLYQMSLIVVSHDFRLKQIFQNQLLMS